MAAAALVFFPLGPAGAQACPYRPEEFRIELGLFGANLRELSDLLDETTYPGKQELQLAAADLHQAIATMAAADLVQLCEIFTRYPRLRDSPQLTATVLRSLPAASKATGSECLELSRDVYLTLFIVNQILEGAEIIAQAVCDASACPVYAGVVVCAPAPPECSFVCPVTIGIVKLLRIVSESFLIEDNNCGLVNHYALVADELAPLTEEVLTGLDSDLQNQVIPNLDLTVSSRATQSSLDILQAAATDGFLALGAQLDAVIADLAAQSEDRETFQELDESLRIEASLQQGRRGRISGLQLPRSLGGQLETVREIVAAAIVMTLAAGEEANNALAFFEDADAFLNEMDYKQAFGSYRLAYQEAARVNEGDRP